MANMWMVRAGENAFLIDDFKKSNVIAIGWEIGDLSGKTPDEIKQIMGQYYPNASNKSLGNNAGQVIKFVCDFQIGDYVITYNPETHNYLVGIITSDYYYSDKLYKKYKENETFYHHFRDIEWIGKTNKNNLKQIALKPLKNPMTVFHLNYSAKADLLTKMNYDRIEWTDFYMELADKLLEYKDDRTTLINKILNVCSNADMKVPTLENDNEGNPVTPYDIDPFSVFGIFNKQIATENRITFVKEFKKEFSVSADAPYTFHGVALVNNLKATFYRFNEKRNDDDIDNLWKLFEIALNFSKDSEEEFIKIYDKVLNQSGILWNITMGLNWVRPFTFINLDSNNRNILSTDEIFSHEFKNEIKSLKSPPKAEQYLHICEECKKSITKSNKYFDFASLSHGAYISKFENEDESDDGIGDGGVKTTRYWVYSPGSGAVMWEEFYSDGIMGIGWSELGNLSEYNDKEEIRSKLKEIYNDNLKHVNDTHAVWQFANEMKEGDIIFAKKGMGEILGRGIVESGYEFDEMLGHYPNIRKVKWTHKGNWPYENFN